MANVVITLGCNSGTLTQAVGGNPTTTVEVGSGDTVTYQSAVAVGQFSVNFSNGCPFSSCPVNSATGAAVSAGQPTAGSVNGTFTYGNVTFGGNGCNNPAGLGIHVHP